MPSTFVVSDTWFNRLLDDDPNANVIDNNEHLIDVWNENVSPGDVVYVLGGLGICDLYNIVIRLNGEIHILNNYYTDDERKYISELKECVKKSSDPEMKNKILFENEQIFILKEFDSVLSYIPLQDWPGKSTGTYCFHGLNDVMELDKHNITCVSKCWSGIPVKISDVQKNIITFDNVLNG